MAMAGSSYVLACKRDEAKMCLGVHKSCQSSVARYKLAPSPRLVFELLKRPLLMSQIGIPNRGGEQVMTTKDGWVEI